MALINYLLPSPAEPNWVSGPLPPGLREVRLRANIETFSGSWGIPESRVDIINTVRGKDEKSTYSHFLLENVLFLRLEPGVHRDEAGRPLPGSVVVLALTPEDVLKVNVARELGHLTVAVRSVNDFAIEGAQKLTLENIRKGTATPLVDLPPLPAPVQRSP